MFAPPPVARPYQNLFQQPAPDVTELLRLQNYAQPQPEIPMQTQASDAYNQLMQQMPVQEPISGMRRFGAALAGFGAGYRDPKAGVEVAEHILQQPYVRKLQEWQNRAKAMEPAMQAERYFNTAAIQDRRIGETNRHNLESEEARRKEIDIRDRRAKVYEFKAQHPDWEFEMVPGGNIMAFNPQNPRERIDTGVPSGSMSEMEKITLNQKNTIAAIGARGTEARTTNEANASNVPFIIGDKMYAWNPKTNSVELIPLPNEPGQEIYRPGVRQQSTGPSASQVKIDQFNRAREAFNNPKWRRYITLDPSSNSFEVKQPSDKWISSYGTPDQATYDEIMDAIYYKDPTAKRNTNKPVNGKDPLGIFGGK